MISISEHLADWVEATGYRDIPEEIVKTAKRSILDCLGTTLAGSRDVSSVLERYLKEVNGPRECTVIGLGMKASSIEAAMANGISGHYLDFDDLVIPVAGAGGPHITAAILPAALAVAEKENKTGSDLIAAYVLGCEVTYRIGRAVDPTHYNSGWHTTGTEGIFGATVAACKLLGLGAEETVYALGIAGSEASGLRENFGSLTKPFHAGEASAKGVKSALLAKCGLTSSRTIFEGKDGFCQAFSKDPRVNEITASLDQFRCLPQIRLKLYPCCAASHAAIYALLQLVKQHDVHPKDVESVKVKGDPHMTVPLTCADPKTALEGKFSIQFPLALGLFERRVTLQDFTDEKIKDPAMLALMSKISLTPDPELRCRDPHMRSAVVEIHLKNGRPLVLRCDYPPGTPENPIPDEEVLEKYRSCARLVLGEKETEESVKMMTNLEQLDQLNRLTSILSGRRLRSWGA